MGSHVALSYKLLHITLDFPMKLTSQHCPRNHHSGMSWKVNRTDNKDEWMTILTTNPKQYTEMQTLFYKVISMWLISYQLSDFDKGFCWCWIELGDVWEGKNGNRVRWGPSFCHFTARCHQTLHTGPLTNVNLQLWTNGSIRAEMSVKKKVKANKPFVI